MGDSTVIKRNSHKDQSSLIPFVGEETETKKEEGPKPIQDYKRRRQSYRAKMTHLTKRTTIQEHRDLINLRMKVLAERGYRLLGPVERVTTETTPQEIEKELRLKRWESYHLLRHRITPKELQFQNPLEARDTIRRKMCRNER